MEQVVICSTAVNIMSWYSPTQSEAADAYYASKSRYMNAASQKYASQRAEDNYRSQRSQSISAIHSCRSEKLNFERRVQDIGRIISALEGSATLSGADVPGSITSFNKTADQTDRSYKESIRCRDIAPANINEVFRCKSVEEDSNSSHALQEYKAEKARLEQALIDLENQINSLESSVEDLTRQISACNAEQAYLRRVMVSSAFDMNHFRRYM